MTTTTPLLSIMYAGLKGGIGKSTSAWLTMLELALRGHRVLGIDADPISQTLADGYRMAIGRGEKVPFTVIPWPTPDGMVDGVHRAVGEHDASALVIDTGGDGQTFDPAGVLCKHMIVPCAPTTPDLRRLIPTFLAASRVGQVKALTGGHLDVSVLLVRTNRSAADAGLARTFLLGQDVPLFDTQVPRRVFYERAFRRLPNSAGAYSAVVDELLDMHAARMVAA